MTPRRTCVGCRRTADVDGLVRLRLGPDGDLQMGPGAGRGAWICAPPAGLACLERALERGALARALRAPVPGDAAQGIRAKLGT